MEKRSRAVTQPASTDCCGGCECDCLAMHGDHRQWLNKLLEAPIMNHITWILGHSTHKKQIHGRDLNGNG